MEQPKKRGRKKNVESNVVKSKETKKIEDDTCRPSIEKYEIKDKATMDKIFDKIMENMAGNDYEFNMNHEIDDSLNNPKEMNIEKQEKDKEIDRILREKRKELEKNKDKLIKVENNSIVIERSVDIDIQDKVKKESEKEQYMFAGTLFNTHFFIHYIDCSEKYQNDISFEIYSILVHEKCVDSPIYNVVVFEFNKTTNETWAVVIQHGNKNQFVRFSKETLEKLFPVISSNKLEQLYLIIYDYSKSGYYVYNAPIKFNAKRYFEIPDEVKFDRIIDVLCTKEFERSLNI